MYIYEGMKIKFKTEQKRYTVQCFNNRFIICTKPFNAVKSVLYSIIDLKDKIRGSDNLIFCMGYETKEQCKWSLKMLDKGELEISYRNRVPLDIEEIEQNVIEVNDLKE